MAAEDAKWHKIARYDSAMVSMPDGTAAAFYRRDRERFLDGLKRTVAIHRRLAAEWDDLAERYRAALPQLTSPEAWEETFRPWLDGRRRGWHRSTGRRCWPPRPETVPLAPPPRPPVCSRSSVAATCCDSWCTARPPRATRARFWAWIW